MKRIFRKQRVLIVVLWLAFMVLANILFYYTEQHIYSEKAQKVLLDHADVIVGQLTSIVEDDYYSRRVLSEMPIAKAKALELALEPYDNIEDARALLDEFAQSAGIEGLAVYDRS